MDYSKNDEFDINNQLFRRARNNISQDSKGIKDLDDDEKDKGEKNLLVYGSELINNLNQINYTFKQLEDYIFVPSKITKKNIKEVIEAGPKAKVEDIKASTPELEIFPIDDVPELGEDVPELGESKKGVISLLGWMTYIPVDRSEKYTLDEIDKLLDIVKKEKKRIEPITKKILEDEGIFSEKDFEDKLKKGPENLSEILGSTIMYLNMMMIDEVYLEKLKYTLDTNEDETQIVPVSKSKDILLEDKYKLLPPQIPPQIQQKKKKKSESQIVPFSKSESQIVPVSKSDINSDILDIIIPKNITNADVDYIEGIVNKRTPMEQIRLGFKGVGIKGDVDKITTFTEANDLLEMFKNEYESQQTGIVGSGRYNIYKGGVGVKGMKRGVNKAKTPKKTIKEGILTIDPTSGETPKKTIDPVSGETPEEFEYIEDDVVADEAKKNLDSAEKLDKSLIDTVNTSQKSPVPSYLTKIYELMTNLIQFIGRTTVLYITRVKKNLNYLDEEQVKLIFSAIKEFPKNLNMLKNFKNKGGALIKDTLYNQTEKETNGLYNEINNSIRNYSKLKDYTTFSGAGMSHLVGGFNDNSFIHQTPTKRFL